MMALFVICPVLAVVQLFRRRWRSAILLLVGAAFAVIVADIVLPPS
jgi:hypothetical protein